LRSYLWRQPAPLVSARASSLAIFTTSAATGQESALTGGGSTHAWVDVFIPGAGWIGFDPTNRIVAGRNLVRVATTRTQA